MFWYAKFKTSLTYFILEKVAERFNNFLEINEIRKTAYVVVRLDDCGFSAKAALYNVWVNGSLCQEINGTNFLCFLFKNTNELFTDYLSLSLWFSNTCKLRVISFLCIYPYKVKVKLSFWTEYTFNLIALILTKKTMVYEYACKLLSNSS